MLLLFTRKSDVLLCAGIRCSVVARSAIVCGLEPASWRSITIHRHRGTTKWWCVGSKVKASNTQTYRSDNHTLGAEHGRQTDWLEERPIAQLHGFRAPWTRALTGIKPATWTRTPQGLKPATWLQQGGQLPATYLTVFPVCLGIRGYCSGKPTQPTDSTPSPPQPPENLSEASQPPGHGLFKFKQLYENPWTVPNFLCVCRIVLAPFLAHLIIQQHFDLSLALFILAGATDLLDGYIARTWPNQKSALGSALDPLADKILISVLYVSLTYAQLIPVALTALVIFRDVGLIAAVFWVRYKTVPPPVTLSKFFNPCYTTAQLKPTVFSKVNTAIQLLLVAASLAAPVFQYTDSLLLQSLWYITAVTTAASGYSYWHYGRKTVRVLNTRSP